jgi:hypothetical protein
MTRENIPFPPAGERCMDCKRTYDLVWAAENDLWNEVVGSSHGQLCPDCFDRRCNAKGLYPFFVAHREHIAFGMESRL